MNRTRAVTIDSFLPPPLPPVKVKTENEEGKVKMEAVPAFPRSSSVGPGTLMRAESKRRSSMTNGIRSILQRRTSIFRRTTTPVRSRAASRTVSASSAPSTVSTATNTTSGLRLDRRPISLSTARSCSRDPLGDDDDEEDDDVSIVSYNSAPAVRPEKSTCKLTFVNADGWRIEHSFESNKISNPSAAIPSIERELRRLSKKIVKQTAEQVY